ncbi:MAG: quinolinate synthase NadA [Methanobacteriota archaeon]|nr:MAG: quinolinate synthase NadA [Euryarchaeota archaeon]
MSSAESITEEEIQKETDRLYADLKNVSWTREDCEIIAPLTLEINRIKKEKNAVILAHSYVTPDIIFGVADFSGDSLGLSKQAAETDADMIVFSGVVFMAETAKILSPDKTVVVPDINAGCSLADGITAEEVRRLKEQYPGVPVVAYVNTTADVKAEADVCVTSANVEQIVNKLDSDRIIFIPDKNMANYLRQISDKEIIDYDATCIVHDNINPESIDIARERYGDLVILAHSECPPDVLNRVDLVEGTSGMRKFIQEHPEAKKIMLATECGLADRFSVEFPDREFIGSCVLCPYMKRNELRKILQVLTDPKPEQIIEIPEDIRVKAKRSLDRMFEMTS